MEIGTIINKRRNELDLTLEDVGNAVGVSKSTRSMSPRTNLSLD